MKRTESILQEVLLSFTFIDARRQGGTDASVRRLKLYESYFLNIYFILNYVSVGEGTCTHVQCPWRAEEGFRAPGSGVTGNIVKLVLGIQIRLYEISTYAWPLTHPSSPIRRDFEQWVILLKQVLRVVSLLYVTYLRTSQFHWRQPSLLAILGEEKWH